jgi:hypothetical protein
MCRTCAMELLRTAAARGVFVPALPPTVGPHPSRRRVSRFRFRAACATMADDDAGGNRSPTREGARDRFDRAGSPRPGSRIYRRCSRTGAGRCPRGPGHEGPGAHPGRGRRDRSVPDRGGGAVYSCCLEALQNVAKYANASSATVLLAQEDGHLEFEVVDGDAGFDPETRGYGTGLQGMADRLAALDGRVGGRGTARRSPDASPCRRPAPSVRPERFEYIAFRCRSVHSRGRRV